MMVSIVIPVYNRFPLVKVMIDSILCQSFSDWELIMIDDGSTDGTYESIQEYVNDKDNIRVILRKGNKKGAPVCRNIGLTESKGDYIVFFDSDDIIAPFCIEQRVNYLDSHTYVDAAVFPARHFKKNIDETDGLLNGVSIFQDDLAEFINSNLPYIVWNAIFRKKSLVSKKITWDESLLSLQDADFNIHTILSGLKIAYADRAKVDYFARAVNNNSISSSIFKQSRFDSHLYFVEKLFSSLSENDRYKYRRDLYDRLIYTYILMSFSYSETHVTSLINIPKKYECSYKFFSICVRINRFIHHRLYIPQRVANIITFPVFIVRKRERAKVRAGYNKSLID